MTVICTSRLQLVPLSHDELSALVNAQGQLPRLGDTLWDPQLVDAAVARAMRGKLAMMERLPSELHPWLTYWRAVLCEGRRAVGLLGFKGPPAVDGSVEIGYGVAPSSRLQGFATEAAEALIGWAFSDSRCQAVTALGVRRQNLASQRVLEKLGMRRVCEDSDSCDWRIERPSEQCSTRHPCCNG